MEFNRRRAPGAPRCRPGAAGRARVPERQRVRDAARAVRPGARRLAPGAFARVNAGGTPWVAMLAVGVFAIALAATGTFELLLGLAIIQVLLIDSWAVVALFRLRARDGPARSAFRVPVGPEAVHRRLHGAAGGNGAGAAHAGRRRAGDCWSWLRVELDGNRRRRPLPPIFRLCPPRHRAAPPHQGRL